MTPTPDPPPAGSSLGSTLTAEQIAAIRILNAQRDSECPWLMRTAEIRWLFERVARDAIIPALDMIETRDREIEALRDRLARAEAEREGLRALMNEWEYQGSTRSIQYRDDLCERWLDALAPTDGPARARGGA